MIVRQFFTWLIFLSLAQGCAQEAKPLPTVQWQFIDADTMQPIEGAFVNFFWRGNADSRGLQTCKYAGLGRSGKDGWFRHTALDPSWREDVLPGFFVPGYEFLEFNYGYPDKDHVTAYIKQPRHMLGMYPAFEQRWKDLGYEYQTKDSFYSLTNQAWTKIMPSKGFHDRTKGYINNNPRRYLVKLRSEPIVADLSFRFVGKVCGDADAINEVNTETAKKADYFRAYHSTKYFCNAAWNSLAPVSWDMSNWIRRAIWLLPEGANESVFVAALPNYYKEAAIQKRNFTALERASFCEIINQNLNEKEKI